MNKYILSAVLFLGLQLAHAEDASAPAPKTDAPAVAATDESVREPATEKSFFETRTFDEMQKELQAVMIDDDSSFSGG